MGLSGLSVNRVVVAAGNAKGTFYVHFTDREAFRTRSTSFHTRVEDANAKGHRRRRSWR